MLNGMYYEQIKNSFFTVEVTFYNKVSFPFRMTWIQALTNRVERNLDDVFNK